MGMDFRAQVLKRVWKMEYLGLKLGQDLGNRAAHPYQEFRGVPPGVDACSRWPEVAILRSTTADAINKQLKRIFATPGLPETITSDNGPQFVSKPFQDFLDIHGISHRKVIPYWPQANDEVEEEGSDLLGDEERGKTRSETAAMKDEDDETCTKGTECTKSAPKVHRGH